MFVIEDNPVTAPRAFKLKSQPTDHDSPASLHQQDPLNTADGGSYIRLVLSSVVFRYAAGQNKLDPTTPSDHDGAIHTAYPRRKQHFFDNPLHKR